MHTLERIIYKVSSNSSFHGLVTCWEYWIYWEDWLFTEGWYRGAQYILFHSQQQENNNHLQVKVRSFDPLSGSFQLQRALASSPLLCPFWRTGPVYPATWNVGRPSFLQVSKTKKLNSNYALFWFIPLCGKNWQETRKAVLNFNKPFKWNEDYPFLHMFPHLSMIIHPRILLICHMSFFQGKKTSTSRVDKFSPSRQSFSILLDTLPTPPPMWELKTRLFVLHSSTMWNNVKSYLDFYGYLPPLPPCVFGSWQKQTPLFFTLLLMPLMSKKDLFFYSGFIRMRIGEKKE